MQNEIWKDIEGFEGLYQVSNLGNVKRVFHKSNYKGKSQRVIKERIKKLGADKDGYKTVMLYKGNAKKLVKVHRIVANAFIDNPNKFSQINHKNEIKTDNRIENLEWCDCKYNNNYGTRNQRMSASKIGHICYSKKDETTGRFVKKEQEIE